ncbi:dihydroorotate dehydrogenase-like protein [candidate division KSB1 bacterium]|nr:dihydroorotate dehydrogenase-like protein [candidate division KSB1 bacterium]
MDLTTTYLGRKLKNPLVASASPLSRSIDNIRRLEDAGADALELNLYYIPTDPALSSDDIERMYLNTLKAVKASVNIPVALKLSPFFSAMANMAKQFDAAGADALVLFNRFYQPDIDLENLEVVPNVILSTPQAMRLPLRWIAILYGKIKADLAATSGIYTASDVLKMLMAGANVTMMASALLRHGVRHISKVIEEMIVWMEAHEYESVEMMQGSMSQKAVAEPAAFERANYIKALHSFQSVY